MNAGVYSYLTYGRQVIRREQTYSGGWVNDNQITYQYTANGWQNFEQRDDWSGGVFANRYDITQVYDKNGNRTGYDKNVTSGFETTYGNPTNLTTTYDNINRPTSVSDADDAGYSCTITNDPTMNITQIEETQTSGGSSSTIYSYFDMDPLNRIISNAVKYSDNGTWKWLKRAHEFSATGAILKSTYKAWNDGSAEPAGDSLHHSWGQDGKHVQNTDTAGVSFGKPWHWAGAQNNHAAPLKNPNADTTSQNAYNLPAAGGAGDPQRRTYVNPTTAGDQRQFWGQGQPEAKDSVNDWRYGKKSKAAAGVFPEIESRFAYFGTVAPTDLDRATDAREKGRVSFFGSGYSYAGSSPRVTSEKIGRDINPLGRGDGRAYIAGWMNPCKIAPMLPFSRPIPGTGASVNNGQMGDLGYDPACFDQWLANFDSAKCIPCVDCGFWCLPPDDICTPAQYLDSATRDECMRKFCRLKGTRCCDAVCQIPPGCVACCKTFFNPSNANDTSCCPDCCGMGEGPCAKGSGGSGGSAPACPGCPVLPPNGGDIWGADTQSIFIPGQTMRGEDAIGLINQGLALGAFPSAYKDALDRAMKIVKDCLQEFVKNVVGGRPNEALRCVLSKAQSVIFVYGGSSGCCGKSRHWDPIYNWLRTHLWCCGKGLDAFWCHNRQVMICESAFKGKTSGSKNDDCANAWLLLHEIGHMCGVGNLYEFWTLDDQSDKNPARTSSADVLKCCSACSGLTGWPT